ncbi:MAG: nucleotidyltransferase [Desulfurococcales archaeon ex4484_42]|nr:MAG: nucleotidyltransferase [Desulfurococcales archaeon ex4484_42]
MKAAIIAGGFGKRLRPLTLEKPKPLVEVAGKSIIQWQIEWFKRYGVDTIVVLTGYLREKIIEFLGSGQKLGVNVVYVVEDEPLGTAGAIKNAEGVLSDSVFLAVNGDIITNIPLDKLVNDLIKSDALASIALVPLRSPYGIVEVDSEGNVKSFKEKPMIEEYLINAGVYAMKPQILHYLPRKGDLERSVFPQLAKEGLLRGVIFKDVYWRAIDTVKDVEEVSKELSSKNIWGSK